MEEHYLSYIFLQTSENRKNVSYCFFPWGGRNAIMTGLDVTQITVKMIRNEVNKKLIGRMYPV